MQRSAVAEVKARHIEVARRGYYTTPERAWHGYCSKRDAGIYNVRSRGLCRCRLLTVQTALLGRCHLMAPGNEPSSGEALLEATTSQHLNITRRSKGSSGSWRRRTLLNTSASATVCGRIAKRWSLPDTLCEQSSRLTVGPVHQHRVFIFHHPSISSTGPPQCRCGSLLEPSESRGTIPVLRS